MMDSKKGKGGRSGSSRLKDRVPPTSFLFIANELPTNDNPEYPGSVEPEFYQGFWIPPRLAQGFLPQNPGYVYRWTNGVISYAAGYQWMPTPVGNPLKANGTIVGPTGSQLMLHRAATVFYCNKFFRFYTARGDAATRDIAVADPEDAWHPLRFRHENNNISYADHTGEDLVAVKSASWINQLVPKAYRSYSNPSSGGGLSGSLPLVIALVAFSCQDQNQLHRALIYESAWSGHQWQTHLQPSGRTERRGMVVSVFYDPENPEGSNPQTVTNVEEGPTPIFF